MTGYESKKVITASGPNQNFVDMSVSYVIPTDIDPKDLFRKFKAKRIEIQNESLAGYEETFVKMYEALSRHFSYLESDATDEDIQTEYMRVNNFNVNACKVASDLIPNSEITVVFAKISKENFSPNLRSKPTYYNYFEMKFINGAIKTQSVGHYDIDAEQLDIESLMEIPADQHIISRSDMKNVAYSLAEYNAALEPTIEELRVKEAESVIDYSTTERSDDLDFSRV